MGFKIALAGNPNTGKTTLFNALTGLNQYVGNWPGVTVEKKSGKYRKDRNVIITDLPGIYSLSPYTLEEVIARNYIINEKPDGILNIIDGPNLERNLYLTTQLLELNIPMVIVVNMHDIITKKGDHIELEKIKALFDCDALYVSAINKENTDQAINLLLENIKHKKVANNYVKYEDKVEALLNEINTKIVIEDNNLKRFNTIKLFEKDADTLKKLELSSVQLGVLDSIINKLDDNAEALIAQGRWNYIDEHIAEIYIKNKNKNISLTEKIDKIVTNRYLALPLFAIIMTLVYYISIKGLGGQATEWTNEVLFKEIIPPAIEGFLESIKVAPWLSSLILDGIVNGVGAVLGFVPQIIVLFIFLALLEGCGYMARIAFIMDRIFRKLGLSGKSFIPMLIGTGCSVPGIMASRTIDKENDRRMTIITTSFMPCSAKLPIIAMISGALFNDAWWVAPSAYFLGILAIIISGLMLKKTKMFEGDLSPFVMELPPYYMPSFGSVVRVVWERAASFITKAGTVILLSSIVIWFGTSFGIVEGSITMLEQMDIDKSFMAVMGNVIAPIFKPLGFGDWKSSIGVVTGLVAKENLITTLGIIYGYAELSENGEELYTTIAANYTVYAAYAYLAFNLICAPCFAAMGAIKREMNNFKWTVFAIVYQCVLAYVFALIIFQFGRFLATGHIGLGFILALVLLLAMIYLMLRKNTSTKKAQINA